MHYSAHGRGGSRARGWRGGARARERGVYAICVYRVLVLLLDCNTEFPDVSINPDLITTVNSYILNQVSIASGNFVL